MFSDLLDGESGVQDADDRDGEGSSKLKSTVTRELGIVFDPEATGCSCVIEVSCVGVDIEVLS